MSLDVFLNFDGNCRDALNFYTEVFNLEMPESIMTYDNTPQGRVLYASLPIAGSNVMFSDCPEGAHYVKGNNFALTLGIQDEAEITKIFNFFANGGTVQMPLAKTFFSEFYGMVTDKFGITWQLSKTQI